MVQKLQNQGHHWWPECVSKHWADETAHAHRIVPDGTLLRSMPKSFGVIRNANHIKVGGSEPNVWDSSFESYYNIADNNFPALIAWLNSLEPKESSDTIPFADRLMPVIVDDDKKKMLGECLGSLISRSPNFRDRLRRTTEHLQRRFGFTNPVVDKNLIAANARDSQKNFSRAISDHGKFAFLYSGDEEFIFGDGFLHNFSSANQPLNGRFLIPVTPEVAVFYYAPSGYRSYPRAMALALTKDEVSFVNQTIQIYSKQYLFFREIHPVIEEDFRAGEYREYKYHKHPWLDDLGHAIAESYFGDDKEFYPPRQD